MYGGMGGGCCLTSMMSMTAVAGLGLAAAAKVIKNIIK
jgi:hypothetical protein